MTTGPHMLIVMSFVVSCRACSVLCRYGVRPLECVQKVPIRLNHSCQTVSSHLISAWVVASIDQLRLREYTLKSC